MAFRDIVPWVGGRRRLMPVSREESPIAALHDEVTSMFDNFFKAFEKEFQVQPFGERAAVFTPRMDMTESEKEIMISVELPGMEEKDIEVSLTKDSLTIKGEKKEEKEEKGKEYYRMERSFGSFQRTIPLPAEVKNEEAKANFKKGLLTIKLPKREEAMREVKKIPVKAE